MKEKTSRSYLSAAEKKILHQQIEGVPGDLRAAFDAAFGRWKETWFAGGLAINSDPHSRTVGKEFDALIALGPGVLPMLIEKLAEPENFLAIQLYDAMQSNERLVVHFAAEDERILARPRSPCGKGVVCKPIAIMAIESQPCAPGTEFIARLSPSSRSSWRG